MALHRGPHYVGRTFWADGPSILRLSLVHPTEREEVVSQPAALPHSLDHHLPLDLDGKTAGWIESIGS